MHQNIHKKLLQVERDNMHIAKERRNAHTKKTGVAAATKGQQGMGEEAE